MPWTLYRYILWELLKILFLSTTVLVVVIGFAAAIKPLSDGLLGPLGLVKFVAYMIPTMLGLAVPFAAAFASTLVFIRMANDNEVLALRASGLSYFTMMLPVFFLGLVLTAGLFYLSNWVVPRFVMLAKKQLEADAIEAFVRQIERRQPFVDKRLIVYAEAADASRQPPKMEGDLQPSKMILLRGVAVGYLEKPEKRKRPAPGQPKPARPEPKLEWEGTAEQAVVLIYQMPTETLAVMRLKNLMVYDARPSTEGEAGNGGGPRGALFSAGMAEPPPLVVPNPIKDNIAFLSWPELRALGGQPEKFGEVAKAKRELAHRIAEEDLTRRIERDLVAGRSVELRSVSAGQRYAVSAPRIERADEGLKASEEPGRLVRVEVFNLSDGLRTRGIEARSATLAIDSDAEATLESMLEQMADGEGGGPRDRVAEPFVELNLIDGTIYDARVRDRAATFADKSLPRATWPRPLLRPLVDKPIGELVSIARSDYADATRVAAGVDGLRRSLSRLGRKIVSQQHERAAIAVAAMLVLLLGALLSIRLRGGMTLVVFFWSFLLATVAVVITHSGENVATTPEYPLPIGLTVIWLGNLAIIAVIGSVYWKLSRN